MVTYYFFVTHIRLETETLREVLNELNTNQVHRQPPSSNVDAKPAHHRPPPPRPSVHNNIQSTPHRPPPPRPTQNIQIRTVE
jgi:hypothetical protein